MYVVTIREGHRIGKVKYLLRTTVREAQSLAGDQVLIFLEELVKVVKRPSKESENVLTRVSHKEEFHIWNLLQKNIENLIVLDSEVLCLIHENDIHILAAPFNEIIVGGNLIEIYAQNLSDGDSLVDILPLRDGCKDPRIH